MLGGRIANETPSAAMDIPVLSQGKAEPTKANKSQARDAADKSPQSDDAARTDAASEKKRADAALRLAEQQRERGEWVAYSRQVSKVQREWNSGNSAVARELLAACQWNLRGWEHRYLHTLLNHRGQRTVARLNDVFVYSLGISPDGKKIISSGATSGVNVWDIESGAWRLAIPTGGYVAFSLDGTRVAGGGANNTITVWDLVTGAEVLTLAGASGRAFAFSPDGKQLVTVAKGEAQQPSNVSVWNLENGQLIRNLKWSDRTVWSIAFHSDGKRLASGDGGMLKVWDVTDGRELLSVEAHGGARALWQRTITSVAFSPDGQTIATNSSAGAIRLWNAADGRELKVIEQAFLSSLAFSPDGRRLASSEDASSDRWDRNAVRVWDVATGANVATYRGHLEPIKCVAFHPDGQRVASAGVYGTIKLWEIDGIQSDKLLPIHAGAIGQVSSSGDGRLLATSGIGHSIKLWDVRAAEQLELRGTFESDGPPLLLQLSRDGQRLASLVRTQPNPVVDVITIWDVATRKPLATLTGHEKPISCFAISPEGEQLATGDAGGLVKVRDTRTGNELRSFKTTQGHANVHELAYSPDGRWLAFAGQDTTIRIWDRADWREVHKITPRMFHEVLSIAFSPDSTRLVSGNEDLTVQMWDVATGTETHTLRGQIGEVRKVIFSPDGRRVVGGSGTDWHVWDAHLGQRLLTLTESVKGTPPAFIADGQAFVTGRTDGKLQIRVADKQPTIRPLTGHTSAVQQVAYSPDGSRLASAGHDHKIKIWDTLRGHEVLTLNGHSGAVNSVSFNSDGTLLASTSADKTTRIWDMQTGRERQVLQGRIAVENIPDWVAAIEPLHRHRATIGKDQIVRVWDIATNRELVAFHGHRYPVSSVAFHPNGRQVTSAGYGPLDADSLGPGVILVWDIPPIDPLKPVEIKPE